MEAAMWRECSPTRLTVTSFPSPLPCLRRPFRAHFVHPFTTRRRHPGPGPGRCAANGMGVNETRSEPRGGRFISPSVRFTFLSSHTLRSPLFHHPSYRPVRRSRAPAGRNGTGYDGRRAEEESVASRVLPSLGHLSALCCAPFVSRVTHPSLTLFTRSHPSPRYTRRAAGREGTDRANA